jgi:S-adenosylmethionine-diacylglycerol 3-amino-3-carboxypropyl transferase
MTKTRSIREQRQFFDEQIAPLFEKPVVRWITGRKSSLFGLGIPPQQYDELASLAADHSIAPVLKHRLEKLACHFPMSDNYFAWQAFGRRYGTEEEGPLPTYLKSDHYQVIRANVDRVNVHHASFTELLAREPAASRDRYILLDAQDWMTDEQLNDVCAEKSIIEGRLAPAIRDQWDYFEEKSRELTALDRSAIYGGFHIYGKKA